MRGVAVVGLVLAIVILEPRAVTWLGTVGTLWAGVLLWRIRFGDYGLYAPLLRMRSRKRKGEESK